MALTIERRDRACERQLTERLAVERRAPCAKALLSLQAVLANLVDHGSAGHAEAFGNLCLVTIELGEGKPEQLTFEEAAQEGGHVGLTGPQGPANGLMQAGHRFGLLGDVRDGSDGVAAAIRELEIG